MHVLIPHKQHKLPLVHEIRLFIFELPQLALSEIDELVEVLLLFELLRQKLVALVAARKIEVPSLLDTLDQPLVFEELPEVPRLRLEQFELPS